MIIITNNNNEFALNKISISWQNEQQNTTATKWKVEKLNMWDSRITLSRPGKRAPKVRG